MKKYIVTINGENYEVVVRESDGTVPFAPVAAAPAPVSAPAAAPAPAPAAAPAPEAAPAPQTSAPADGFKLTSPLPGTLLKIAVKVGQTVNEGDLLCVVEAMKMENEIVSPKGGTVSHIEGREGASISSGELILVIS